MNTSETTTLPRFSTLAAAIAAGVEIHEDLTDLLELHGEDAEFLTSSRDSFENYTVDGPSTWNECGEIEIESGDGWKFATIDGVQIRKGQPRATVKVVEIAGAAGTFYISYV